MQSKNSFKKPIFIVSIAGIAFLAIIILFSDFILPSQNSYAKPALPVISQPSQNLIIDKQVEPTQNTAYEEQVISGLPVRLKIPKINIDAAFEYVGLTADGSMDVPKNSANAAWFGLGSRPGDIGSAAIAGHYGIKNGKASVFDNLHKLRKGDKIYVEDEKGSIIVFVVIGSRRYDSNADASDVFSSNDGKSHLNLITCEGVWDEVSKSYSKRLVIFADRE